jgi:hypothetical protein
LGFLGEVVVGVQAEEQENLDGEGDKEGRKEVKLGGKGFVDALVSMYFNKSASI